MTITSPIAPTQRDPLTRNRAAVANRRRSSTAQIAVYVLLTFLALVWLFPLVWAVYNSFRDYDYVLLNGYLSVGGFTFSNYIDSWNIGGIPHYFLNSLIITVPSVLLILFFGSMAAFILARFSWKFNIFMLAVFIAGNLLRSRLSSPHCSGCTTQFRFRTGSVLPDRCTTATGD